MATWSGRVLFLNDNNNGLNGNNNLNNNSWSAGIVKLNLLGAINLPNWVHTPRIFGAI